MTHTSLKLSKKLFENGCELGNEYYWAYPCKHSKASPGYRRVGTPVIAQLKEMERFDPLFPAYDILNDICVKYVKEFFGEPGYEYYYITAHVLAELQRGNKQEAEDYIWTHCLFNPKNASKKSNK